LGREHQRPSNLSSENLEGLAEKVGSLSLKVTGAVKKQVRRARLVEAPSGDFGGGQPWSAPGGQPETLQKPSTSGVQQGRSTESKGLPVDPSKRQRSAVGIPRWAG